MCSNLIIEVYYYSKVLYMRRLNLKGNLVEMGWLGFDLLLMVLKVVIEFLVVTKRYLMRYLLGHLPNMVYLV